MWAAAPKQHVDHLLCECVQEMCRRLNTDITRLKAQKVAVQRNLETSAKQHAQWRLDREKVRMLPLVSICCTAGHTVGINNMCYSSVDQDICLLAYLDAGAGAAAAPEQAQDSHHPGHAGGNGHWRLPSSCCCVVYV